MSVVIVIPALNESKFIAKIVNESSKFGTVVVVDDGSVDNTFRLAQEAGAIVISHAKNMGYGKSILDGFKYAKENNYDYLITLDGDNQHNSLEIPNFLKTIKNCDIVLGNRFLGNSSIPRYRKFGIKVISKLNGIEDSQCGFRAFNEKAINIILDNAHETGMSLSTEVLKIAKFYNLKIFEIPCGINYNQTKHSKNFLSHGFDLILVFAWWMIWKNPAKTLLPLDLAFLLGTIIAGTQTLSLYAHLHTIILSWALLTGILLLGTLMLFNIFVFIVCFKNRKVEA